MSLNIGDFIQIVKSINSTYELLQRGPSRERFAELEANVAKVTQYIPLLRGLVHRDRNNGNTALADLASSFHDAIDDLENCLQKVRDQLETSGMRRSRNIFQRGNFIFREEARIQAQLKEVTEKATWIHIFVSSLVLHQVSAQSATGDRTSSSNVFDEDVQAALSLAERTSRVQIREKADSGGFELRREVVPLTPKRGNIVYKVYRTPPEKPQSIARIQRVELGATNPDYFVIHLKKALYEVPEDWHCKKKIIRVRGDDHREFTFDRQDPYLDFLNAISDMRVLPSRQQDLRIEYEMGNETFEFQKCSYFFATNKVEKQATEMFTSQVPLTGSPLPTQTGDEAYFSGTDQVRSSSPEGSARNSESIASRPESFLSSNSSADTIYVPTLRHAQSQGSRTDFVENSDCQYKSWLIVSMRKTRAKELLHVEVNSIVYSSDSSVGIQCCAGNPRGKVDATCCTTVLLSPANPDGKIPANISRTPIGQPQLLKLDKLQPIEDSQPVKLGFIKIKFPTTEDKAQFFLLLTRRQRVYCERLAEIMRVEERSRPSTPTGRIFNNTGFQTPTRRYSNATATTVAATYRRDSNVTIATVPDAPGVPRQTWSETSGSSSGSSRSGSEGRGGAGSRQTYRRSSAAGPSRLRTTTFNPTLFTSNI